MEIVDSTEGKDGSLTLESKGPIRTTKREMNEGSDVTDVTKV